MTRVSSFGQQQMMVQGLLDNQKKVFEDQRQLNTGKVSDQFQGLPSNVASLIGARSFKSQTDSFQEVIKTVDGRISANDVQVWPGITFSLFPEISISYHLSPYGRL